MQLRFSVRTYRLILLCGYVCLCACGTPVYTNTYTVKEGDTLYSIAQRTGVDYRTLARWNHIGSDYRIHVGQVLHLRPAKQLPGQKTTAALRKPPVVKTLPPTVFKWNWPVSSRTFTATTRPNGGRGLMIQGGTQEAIYAVAAGKVMYSGIGLLGYGQLLIIKHDTNYLSAYGYVTAVKVREGEQVQARQQIASMGAGPKGSPLLYFEIRAQGQAIDPLRLLP